MVAITSAKGVAAAPTRGDSHPHNLSSFGRVVLMLALSLLTGWILAGRMATVKEVQSKSVATSPKENNEIRQRKIYIDLGANCGNSYYRFKNGGEPRSMKAHYHFKGDDKTTLSTSDWEAYLWECNPQMINWYLNDLIEKETAQGFNVTLIPKAASTADGTIPFFLTKGLDLDATKDKALNPQCDPDSLYNPSGASTIFGNTGRAGEQIEVPALDFLAWFKKLELTDDDIVHLKMDIEGAEMDILEAFLADETNQICTWSQFWIEWHATIFPVDSPEYVRNMQSKESFDTRYEQKCGRMPTI